MDRDGNRGIIVISRCVVTFALYSYYFLFSFMKKKKKKIIIKNLKLFFL